jgi:outer membrane murein-binding lipoprotein Lpp
MAEINGRVTNRDIYEAVTDLRHELGAKIDKNSAQGASLDVRMARLEVKVDNVCNSADLAISKAEAVEAEVDNLKLERAKSNKQAGVIGGAISVVINGAVAIYNAIAR